MDANPISPLSLYQSYSSGMEVAYDPEKECVKCTPTHICRNCNARWQGHEPSVSSPLVIASNWLIFKEKCRPVYHKYRWYLMTLITAIVITVIVLAVVFRPKHAIGLYRNGSGLVALDRGDDSAVIDIFFQHVSGQIRHIVLNDTSSEWSGGLPQDNILSPYAPAPRPGTPLMAVSYTIGNETTWKVFYVDSSDILQESMASTTTSEFPTNWLPGPLGLSQFKAHSSSHTGISVCKHMLWSPDPLGLNNGGLVLLYGGQDGMNHMLTHEIQDTAWKFNHTFMDSSAASGIECTSRGSEILDTWMINSEGQVLQASFNFNPQSEASVYRAGSWTTGVVYDQEIQLPTSISAIKYTGNASVFESNSTFVHFVAPGGIVKEINADTYNRSHVPVIVTGIASNFSASSTISQSKIASVAVRTNSQNLETQERGRDRKMFMQLEKNPEQISVMSANFYEDLTPNTLQDGVTSNIQE